MRSELTLTLIEALHERKLFADLEHKVEHGDIVFTTVTFKLRDEEAMRKLIEILKPRK